MMYRNAWNRTRRYNKNYLAAFCGQTGSGKSWAALRMAHDLDVAYNGRARFNIDRVVFSAEDFINLVKQKLPKGSFIIWDEVGIGINSRTFYNQQNLNISYVTQTFRSKNYGVLYTVPSFGYVDKQVRQLFHAYFEMKRINFSEKVGFARYFDIIFSPRFGTVRYPQPRKIEFGIKEIIDGIGFPKPPKELIDQYEEKKEIYLDKMYEIYKDGASLDNVGNNSKESINQLAQKVIEDINNFTNEKGKIERAYIIGEFGIGRDKAEHVRKIADKMLLSSLS